MRGVADRSGGLERPARPDLGVGRLRVRFDRLDGVERVRRPDRAAPRGCGGAQCIAPCDRLLVGRLVCCRDGRVDSVRALQPNPDRASPVDLGAVPRHAAGDRLRAVLRPERRVRRDGRPIAAVDHHIASVCRAGQRNPAPGHDLRRLDDAADGGAGGVLGGRGAHLLPEVSVLHLPRGGAAAGGLHQRTVPQP